MVRLSFFHPLGVLLAFFGAWIGSSSAPVGAAEMIRWAESARGLAMGGALTAVAESFDAMVYNPAGLAQTNYWKIEVGGFTEASEAGDGRAGNDFFTNLKDFAGKSDAAIESHLTATGSAPHSTRTFGYGGFHTGTGLGLAVFESESLRSTVATAVAPITTDVTYDKITGGVFTFSDATDLKFLMWGFSITRMAREASKTTLEAPFAGTLAGPAYDPKIGTPGKDETSFDLGFLARLPIPFLRPTFGIAYLNGRSPDFGLKDVDPLRAELNVGLSIMPDLFPETMRILLAYDIRDVQKEAFPDDQTGIVRQHIGAEFSFFSQGDGLWGLSLRGGRSQGFFSWGVGVRLSHYLSLDYAVYKEETGTGTIHLAQKRQLLQVSLGF